MVPTNVEPLACACRLSACDSRSRITALKDLEASNRKSKGFPAKNSLIRSIHHPSTCSKSIGFSAWRSFKKATYFRMLSTLPLLVRPPSSARTRSMPCFLRMDWTADLPNPMTCPPPLVNNDSGLSGIPRFLPCRVTTKATQSGPLPLIGFFWANSLSFLLIGITVLFA